MKKFISLPFTFITCLSFFSCDKDDVKLDSSNLIGTWIASHTLGNYKDSQHPEYYEEWDKDDNTGETYTFNTDGTFINIIEDVTEKGTWQLEGDQLTINSTWSSDPENNANLESGTATIVELDETTLIMEYSEKTETIDAYSKDTFIKIK